MSYLRSELLREQSIALGGVVPPVVQERLETLGARVAMCPSLEEEELLEWAASSAPLDALVMTGGALESLDRSWALIRAVANGAMIPAARGAIVLIAPAPNEVEHSEAVRSALENLARTLSVEWSRFGITTAAIAPGQRTGEDELAALVAFLCSVAGRYFSGCRLDLNLISR